MTKPAAAKQRSATQQITTPPIERMFTSSCAPKPQNVPHLVSVSSCTGGITQPPSIPRPHHSLKFWYTHPSQNSSEQHTGTRPRQTPNSTVKHRTLTQNGSNACSVGRGMRESSHSDPTSADFGEKEARSHRGTHNLRASRS